MWSPEFEFRFQHVGFMASKFLASLQPFYHDLDYPVHNCISVLPNDISKNRIRFDFFPLTFERIGSALIPQSTSYLLWKGFWVKPFRV